MYILVLTPMNSASVAGSFTDDYFPSSSSALLLKRLVPNIRTAATKGSTPSA